MGMVTTVLPWQLESWQHLDRLRSEDRLPHALLLTGPAGIGKRRFARALMQSLVCSQPGVEGACGRCRECGFGLDHPDIHDIVPPEGKRQIAVDQVRELVEVGHRTALRSGGRKVIGITPADAMNPNTANALLKTLEEPAGDTVLILVSDAPARLLPTIRSRCRQMVFPVPEKALAQAWVEVMIPETQAREAALRECGGRPLAAVELYESEGLEGRQSCDAILAKWQANAEPLTETAEALLQWELDFVLEWLAQRLHHLFRATMTGEDATLPEQWQAWRKRDPRMVSDTLERVLALRGQYNRGVALNARLTLESLLAQWCRPRAALTT